MQACAAVNAAALGLLAVVATFAACTQGMPAADAPPPIAAQGEPQPSPAIPARALPVAEPAPTPAAAAKAAPASAADCKELVTEITNEPPDGGVVMNNAMTSADAGTSDRLAPLISLMRERRDGFRCCFDLWGRAHPGADGRVVLQLSIKPDGSLAKAEVDAARSTVSVPEVTSCMVDLAKSLNYPLSPSGRDTQYSHLFEFKARR